MTRSMTGYARRESQGPWGRLSLELRAVNHRYFDLSLRLPEDLRGLEQALRQAATARIARGKLDATLKYSREGASEVRLEVDQARLRALRAAADEVASIWGDTAPADPARLLSYPGVVSEQSPDMAPVEAAAATLFEDTLTSFDEARASEGARLEQFMLERCTQVEELVAGVRARYAQVRGQGVERLRSRAAELGVELEPGRLEQEMVIALQKLDVEEEMSRLLSHVAEVRSALARPDSVGRRLDFLMQELNREANTLSSKSQDAELTRLSVELKVCIEQCREQVQNIE